VSQDPRLIRLVTLAAELYPVDHVYFIAIQPLDGTPLQSLANVSTDVQLRMLEALVRSFKEGTASPFETISIDRPKP
jgi:biotin synthase-like enzyme